MSGSVSNPMKLDWLRVMEGFLVSEESRFHLKKSLRVFGSFSGRKIRALTGLIHAALSAKLGPILVLLLVEKRREIDHTIGCWSTSS